MFSKSFPDIKSPEQMAFESEMLGAVQEDEIDLDELSAAEFLTDSESEQDGDNLYEILDDMDFLGAVDEKANARDGSKSPDRKKIRIDPKGSEEDKSKQQRDEENESAGPSTSKGGKIAL